MGSLADGDYLVSSSSGDSFSEALQVDFEDLLDIPALPPLKRPCRAASDWVITKMVAAQEPGTRRPSLLQGAAGPPAVQVAASEWPLTAQRCPAHLGGQSPSPKVEPLCWRAESPTFSSASGQFWLGLLEGDDAPPPMASSSTPSPSPAAAPPTADSFGAGPPFFEQWDGKQTTPGWPVAATWQATASAANPHQGSTSHQSLGLAGGADLAPVKKEPCECSDCLLLHEVRREWSPPTEDAPPAAAAAAAAPGLASLDLTDGWLAPSPSAAAKPEAGQHSSTPWLPDFTLHPKLAEPSPVPGAAAARGGSSVLTRGSSQPLRRKLPPPQARAARSRSCPDAPLADAAAALAGPPPPPPPSSIWPPLQLGPPGQPARNGASTDAASTGNPRSSVRGQPTRREPAKGGPPPQRRAVPPPPPGGSLGSACLLAPSALAPGGSDLNATWEQQVQAALHLGAKPEPLPDVPLASTASIGSDELFVEDGRKDGEKAGPALPGGGREAAGTAPSTGGSSLLQRLVQFAEAVATDDQDAAKQLMLRLHREADPGGAPEQRVAYYFMAGISVRLQGLCSASRGREPVVALPGGMGALAWSHHFIPPPKAFEYYATLGEITKHVPYRGFLAKVVNSTFLEAAAGASEIHILDLGWWHSSQWPSLMRDLAAWPRPPHLRITKLDSSPSRGTASKYLKMGLSDIKLFLTKEAAAVGLPFEFRTLDTRLEYLQPHMLGDAREGEVLLVNGAMRFHTLSDGSVVRSSPRDAALRAIRKLGPRAFVLGEKHVDHNGPFFLRRFSDCLSFYAAVFDSLDAPGGMARDSPVRRLFEEKFLGTNIVNVVACEGLQRVCRSEPLGKWQVRLREAGFAARPVGERLKAELVEMLAAYPREFGVREEEGVGNALMLTWKGRPMFAASIWHAAG